ncbi:Thiosulfate sulfurtransferase rdl2, mitochondrial [Ophidiomyces ophidiicola]|nr:Thiosulfate sulfurtransferase rdl2, mitochondrial [Ophidiomyces ophidiicola]
MYISNTLTTPTAMPTIIIDVREPKELVSTGIIPTSLSIPLSLQPDAFFLTPDEFLTRFGFAKPMATSNNSEKSVNANIVFYCRAGVRAQTAADFAVHAGYQRERIGVYSGSWLDWEKKGGKVEKWDKKN